MNEDRRAFREGRSEIVEEITDWKADRRFLLTRKVVFENESGGWFASTRSSRSIRTASRTI